MIKPANATARPTFILAPGTKTAIKAATANAPASPIKIVRPDNAGRESVRSARVLPTLPGVRRLTRRCGWGSSKFSVPFAGLKDVDRSLTGTSSS